MKDRSFSDHIRTLERRAAHLQTRVSAASSSFECQYDKAELGSLKFALGWLRVLREEERTLAIRRKNARVTNKNDNGAAPPEGVDNATAGNTGT
jgi:hypothetical protein